MNLDLTSVIVALISSGGLLAAGSAARSGIRWLTGREERERSAITTARRELEVEWSRRRQCQEVAASIRLVALSHGVPESELPAVPRWTDDPRSIPTGGTS